MPKNKTKAHPVGNTRHRKQQEQQDTWTEEK